MNKQRVWVGKGNKTNNQHDKHWPLWIKSLYPDRSMGNPMESPRGFSWDFLSQPLTCLQFWLFLLSSLQGSACVLLSLAKADSKVGLQIYGRPLEAKAAEIPVRKSDLLTLASVLKLTEKIRISSWRKPRSDLIVNRSLKTPVKIQLQRDSPEAGEGNTGEKCE